MLTLFRAFAMQPGIKGTKVLIIEFSCLAAEDEDHAHDPLSFTTLINNYYLYKFRIIHTV